MIKLIKQTKVQIIIICLFAIIPYLNIFQNSFVIDDRAFVGWAQSKSIADIPNIFKGEVPLGHEGVFRPIRGVLYYLYSSISTNPTIFHLHSILVNLLCSILIYLIASKILKNSLLGFLIATAFASHPIHTEALTYMTAGVDSLGSVFMLLSFYLYILSHSHPRHIIPAKAGIHIMSYLYGSSIKSRMTLYIGSIISALLAFFTYEMTLTLPLLIVLYDVILRAKPEGSRFFTSFRMTLKKSLIYLPYFIVLLTYLLVRLSTIGISGRAPYPGDSTYITFLTMIKVFMEYIRLVFFPTGLVNNHILPANLESFIYRGYNAANFKSQSIIDSFILSYIIIYIGIFILAWRTFKKFPIITFSILWFFITLLPVAEIIPQGSVMGERFLYVPSFGLILLFVWGLTKLIKNKPLLLGIVLTISVFLGFFTFMRNKDWKDDFTLWSKDIKVAPNANTYAYFQLGNALRNKGEYKEAVENFKKAYEINPNFLVAKASEAQIYDLSGNDARALKLYLGVLDKDPYFWEAYRERGKIFMQQKKFDQAKTEFETLLMIYPSNQEAQKFLLIVESMRLENEKRK